MMARETGMDGEREEGRGAACRTRQRKQNETMALLATAGAFLAAAIFLQYLIPCLLLALCCRDADLKKKYGAEWGLVTGASSGAFFFFLCLALPCVF